MLKFVMGIGCGVLVGSVIARHFASTQVRKEWQTKCPHDFGEWEHLGNDGAPCVTVHFGRACRMCGFWEYENGTPIHGPTVWTED